MGTLKANHAYLYYLHVTTIGAIAITGLTHGWLEQQRTGAEGALQGGPG